MVIYMFTYKQAKSRTNIFFLNQQFKLQWTKEKKSNGNSKRMVIELLATFGS